MPSPLSGVLLKTGDQNVVPDQVVFDKICDGLKYLANSFETGKSVLEPLGTIVTAGFAVTAPETINERRAI